MNRLAVLHRRFRRLILARRRLLAAVAAATAVAAGLQAAAGPPPSRAMVLTAARDIPGGTVVRAADLEPVPFDPATVPTGVLESAGHAVGRTTAGPVRAGEPITDVRLLSGSLVAGYPGTVAVPLRVGDPGAVGLLRVGDRIDVVAADPQGAREPVVVAADVPVVALPRTRDTGLATAPGGLMVVAVPEQSAPEVAAAGVAAFLSVVIRR